ncbi:hypothetical protein Ae201684P_009257 [Aphanomyces euteiches]|uniref:subtilisin n=1 Tax=Aphanomyces euteiches TaxID=100861 RepID=A0A6G0WNF3_9STRA|nr:hypothetical protein Ae201684_013465 [Aphanomyces euteiches]KAH9062992.1 hypothetical protein Ae201684P_009257 [Aphanomyces euteiches]KAH9150326.1 hypothetical protein AeRB84_006804 [Aphanomyces euteiches]
MSLMRLHLLRVLVLVALAVEALKFDSANAWCQYFCSPFVLKSPPACAVKCPLNPQRRLYEAQPSLDLLADCPLNLHLNMTSEGASFHSFWTQFQAAIGHLVDGDELLVGACRLALLDSSTNETTPAEGVYIGQQPHNVQERSWLVQLQRHPQEHLCVDLVRSKLEGSSRVSLMSRSNGVNRGATILLVHSSQSLAQEIDLLPCVSKVVALAPLFKLSPLARSVVATYNAQSPPLEIVLAKNVSTTAVFPSLNHGLFVATGIYDVVALRDDGKLVVPPLANFHTWATIVSFLCRQSIVHHITRSATLESFALSIKSRRLDDDIESIIGTDEMYAHGIRGNGVVVGITDSGLYLDHDQFDQNNPREYDEINLNARKVVLYQALADKVDQSSSVTCGHGTHVSGILAGSSFSQKYANVGVAPKAKIAFTDIGKQDPSCADDPNVKCPVKLSTPPDAIDHMGVQLQAGAKIFSYSWGLQKDDYSSQAQNLDQFLYDHPDIVVVIAAGNAGTDGLRTISSPAGAKNVITVGASMSTTASLESKFDCPRMFNPQSVTAYSSQGPTSDGRLKPDVVAPGEILWSAQSQASTSRVKTSDLCPLQGTSQATPVVSGMAVLLHEWLRDGWWKAGSRDLDAGMPYIPSALLKALLIHSARGLYQRLDSNSADELCKNRRSRLLHYPDIAQGFGLPSMSNLAFFGSDSQPLVSFWPNATHPKSPKVGHGDVDFYYFTLEPNDKFRATLVWTDPPGDFLATRMLQNDLDLSITVRGAPWIVVNPLTIDGEKRDSRNNVEMVQVSYNTLKHRVPRDVLNSDASLQLIVRVRGSSVLVHGPQAYSLVATYSPAQVDSTSTTALQSKGHRDGSPQWLWIVLAAGPVMLAALWVVWRHRQRPTVVIRLPSDNERVGLVYGSA